MGTYACGDCISGQDDCTGDSNCECDLGTSACSICGFTSGVNNYASDCLTCVCDTGYRNCGDILVVNNPDDNPGCNDDYSGGGRDDCSVLGAYSSTNTGITSTCDCECIAGYGHCTSEGNPDDSLPETNGCEIHFDTNGYCSALDGAYGDQNNDVDTNCDCVCQSGYLDCNSTMADGCEIQEGASCGDSTGTYAVGECSGINGNCTATGGNQDCDDDDGDADLLSCNGVNGCEIDTAGACYVGALVGSYGGDCTCDVDAVVYGTSGIEYSWSGILPFLWFTSYGSTIGMNLSFVETSKDFIVNNTGAYWDGTDLTDTGAGSSDGNASSICSDNEVLLGQDISTCVNLNDTIDDRTGSGKSGGGDLLYNDTDYIYLNETELNSSINDSIDERVSESFLQNILDTVYVQISDLVSMVGNWSADKPNYVNMTRLDNESIIRDHNTSWAQGVSVGGEASGTVGNIVIGNDVLDDQYYDSESDLTSLLNDDYASKTSLSDYWNMTEGLLDYENLTTCGDNEVLKMSGASWNCEADAEGAGGASHEHDQDLNTTDSPTFVNITVSQNLTINENLTLTSYTSCNLDTDANGNLVCGTDAEGAGGASHTHDQDLNTTDSPTFFNATVTENLTINDLTIYYTATEIIFLSEN